MLDVELFAGPGGWDVAARLLNIHTVGLEWDLSACQTAMMAGFVRLKMDVAKTSPWAMFGKGIRLLIASPPCQAFSAAGKGKGRDGAHIILEGVAMIAAGMDSVKVCEWVDAQMDDSRAALVLEPLRWALALNPETIALEQVPAVLPLWEAMAVVLRNAGYSVWCGILQAEQYDTGQTRKRAILIASRNIEVKAPEPVRRKYRKGTPQDQEHKLDQPGLKPWISMKQALGHGLNKRPSYTVLAGGAETGGAEPFANGARKGMRAAQEAGDWELRMNSAPHAAVRSIEEPASTVFFGERVNAANWVLRSNYNGPPTSDGSPRERTRRSVDEPSSVVTSKLGHWEPQAMGDVRSSNGSVRDVQEPAATITASMDNGNFRWLRSNHGHFGRPRDPDTGKQVVRIGDSDFYLRTSVDDPAPTVSSGTPKGAHWDSAEPNGDGSYRERVSAESVRVTVQEAAVLQGFPADYPWQGNKGQQHRQVGDAMPPPLAWHVLRAAFGLPVQHYPGTENL